MAKREIFLPQDIEEGAVYYVQDTNNLYVDTNDKRNLVNARPYWDYELSPWEEIIYNKNYATDYQIGKLMDLDFGEYGVHQMELVAIDADDKADGSGKARMTWISKDIITLHEQPSTIKIDGWGSADNSMREFVNNTLMNQLPIEVKNSIVPVNKTYAVESTAYGDYFSTKTNTIEETLWIPSAREIFGQNITYNNTTSERHSENSGAIYDSIFKDSASRIKTYNNVNTIWWTRTTFTDAGTYTLMHVLNDGNLYLTEVGNYGIVVGFCI